MPAALGQEQVAGPQGIAYRLGQRDLPDPPVDPTVGSDHERAPGGRHEALRVAGMKSRAGAGVQRASRATATSSGSLPAAAWKGSSKKAGRYWRKVA